MKKPELLAPAGDMERLQMALAYGADAVYLAGTMFGMRSFAGNFTPEELKTAVELCHSKGVRVHVTCNTMPRNEEVARLPEWLEYLDSVGVDAIILADVGTLALAKRHAPHVQCHISTQASIVNYQSATAWHDLGASRVILARELSLDEIREIRLKTPKELEIEAFAHGAMCVSYSGRCLLSNYMTGRDANRGACAQPCRYQYALMEEKRPGEYFPVFEENGETYIMNSKDMCMIDHVAELMEAGLDSLKLEGRAKSAYYAAIVTGAYRHAIDAAAAGQPLDPVWRDEVEHISHRHYSTGFYFGQPGQYTENSRYVRDWKIVAKVQSCDEQGNATLTLNNKFSVGDTLELVGPDVRPQTLTVGGLWDEAGEALEQVRKPQMVFRMKLPQPVPPLSLLRRQKAAVLLAGPGLGYTAQSTARAAETRTLIQQLLSGFAGCAVLDADGLNAAAGLLSAGQPLPHPAGALVLTPHPGEMARLTGLSTPGLARGGSGDALAGILAALLACGLEAAEAAACAAWLHGAAADRAAAQRGEYGMLPQDLFPALGTLFAENGR